MMADLTAFLNACVRTGALFTSLCATFVVPVLVWIGVRQVERIVKRMDDDVRWQASVAAIAALLPAATFTSLATFGLVTAWHSACLQYTSGRILFGALASLVVVALGRATFQAIRRRGEAQSLAQLSSPPSDRLARCARPLGLSVRQLPSAESLCALVGIRNPVILLSDATVASLSDSELEAALLHEAAHRRRADHVVGLLISFCSDFLPLPVSGLIEVYHRAREVAADAYASERSDALDVVGAILAVASQRPTPLAAPALYGAQNTLRHRIERLFAPDAAPPALPHRLLAVPALIILAAAGVAPIALTLLHVFGMPCGLTMS